ncbi:hypothetical protein EJ110_NYTH34366 [Nymphaea thermarum]|nr:hypothetical protein EJ110_NYTH34366 [Nymphaea thermarum]
MLARRIREASPERTKVWMEQRAPRQEHGVLVLYYLCRNGQFEHLHFLEFLYIRSMGCTSEEFYFLECYAHWTRTKWVSCGSLEIFHQMRMDVVQLTQATFTMLIKACADNRDLGFTRQLHSCAFKTGFASDTST